MKSVTADFDTPADYSFDAGLELIGSTIRLVDPNDATPRYANFQVNLPGPTTLIEVIASIPSGCEIWILAKQNEPVTDSEVLTDGKLIDQSQQSVVGLVGEVNIGLCFISTEGNQVSLDTILFHHEADVEFDSSQGNLGVVQYDSGSSPVTHLTIERPAGTEYDLSNIVVQVDNENIPYIVADARSSSFDIITTLPNPKDNITLAVDINNPVYWSAKDLGGYGLDWSTCTGGINFQGLWYREATSWRVDAEEARVTIPWTVSDEPVALHIVSRKYLPNLVDKANMTISLGSMVWDIPFDDENNFMVINGEEVDKVDMPWTSNFLRFGIWKQNDKIICTVDDKTVWSGEAYVDYTSEASIKVSSNNCGFEIRSLYAGKLKKGTTSTVTREVIHPQPMIDGAYNSIGYMLYAGAQDLRSAGAVVSTHEGTYIGTKKVDLPTIPLLDRVTGPIYAFRDLVSKEDLFFVSSTEVSETYMSRAYGPWELLSDTYVMQGLWRSLHTEGLLVTKEGYNSVSVILLHRIDGLLEISETEFVLTALPTNQEYHFEAPIDQRIAQKTIPWVWVKD